MVAAISTEGPLECSHCGLQMTASSGGTSVRYHRCPGCGRWSSSMYSEMLRADAGIRRGNPATHVNATFESVKARLQAWMQRLDAEDPYQVLGVDPADSAETIRDRYRRLASVHHPDHGGDAAAMQQLNEAYERIRHRCSR